MAEAVSRYAGRLPRKIIQPLSRPTPPAVAVIDREGMVIGVLASRVEARAFMRRGGAA